MTDIDKIILDLKIIKQIKENDKLALIKQLGTQSISVDNYNYLSSISRWYNGYNRLNTIEYLENLNIKIENVSNLLNEGSHIIMNKLLSKNLEDSKIGFENLKKTYETDSINYAKLNIIIEKLENIKQNLKLN